MNKYQEALDKIAKHTNNPRSMYFNLGANEPKKYLDLLQELVDKETPKKVLRYKSQVYISLPKCPICKTIPHTCTQKYCDECGQALDWSDE